MYGGAVNIIFNGRQKGLTQPTSLKSLVEQSCRDSNHVIAELNGIIIKNHQWDKTVLKDGDTLELVNFVGGG